MQGHGAFPMKNQSSPNISSEVFSTLKERIIRWDYAPGHRFTEEALCDEFGMSRSPIREALRMLVENGLVVKEPHRGYSVKQPDMKEIFDLYDVRLALETYVVATLAQKGMPAEVWGHLCDTWQSIQAGIPNMNQDFPAKDEEFHEALAQATGNTILLQTIRGIDERLHFIRIYDITNPERLQRTCEQHLKILACIQDQDVACAQEAMQRNIHDGRQTVEQALKEAISRAFLGKL
jgi:DNA-binding GntR family transcriptional regulator